MSSRRNSKSSPARTTKGRAAASPSRSTSTNGGSKRRGATAKKGIRRRHTGGSATQSEDEDLTPGVVSTDDEIDVPSEERANDNAIDEYAHPSLSPLKLVTPTSSPRKVGKPVSARKLFQEPVASPGTSAHTRTHTTRTSDEIGHRDSLMSYMFL
jgi:hypothetical protein